MKQRTEANGTKVNDWETPKYIYDYLEKEFFKDKDYFDPCPLNSNFDGLKLDWKEKNYINPPYSPSKLKEAFIIKSYEESKKGKLCIMLIPASTETKIFHDIIVPNALVILIKKRIMFKGYNSKGEYVTGKTGQSGSMFIVFGGNYKKEIITLDLEAK